MIKKKVFSKKGNLVTDNPVALILVILVIASVLMFLYGADINKYLRNLPGYSTPQEDEFDLSGEEDKETNIKEESFKRPIEEIEIVGECSDCKKKFWNSCSVEQCISLGKKIGKNCEYDDGSWYNLKKKLDPCKELGYQESFKNFDIIEKEIKYESNQLRDTDKDLIIFLNCMSEEYFKLEKKYLAITSLTNDALYGSSPSCDLNNYDSKRCDHMEGSCHYFMENGKRKSRAADIRTKGYDARIIEEVFDKCDLEFNSLNARDNTESDHFHVEIKGSGDSIGC
tara:strand:+ start:188 stop:1036 length:849 start_codon:yes stop_codon:yes gene_type:complete